MVLNMKRCIGLESFGFKSKNPKVCEPLENGATTSQLPLENEDIGVSCSNVLTTANLDTVDEEQINAEISSLDIGLYIGKLITDELKYKLLKDVWVPDSKYKMPFTMRMSKGKTKKRYLRLDH